MQSSPTRLRFLIYLEAAGAVFLMLGLRWLLNPVLSYRLPFVTMFFAVFYASWRGGWWPALLATALSAVGSAMLFFRSETPFYITDPTEQIGLILFLASGIAVAWLGERSLGDRRRAEESLRKLRDSALATDQERVRAEEEAVRAEDEAVHAEEIAAQAEEEREQTRAILDSISDAFLALDHNWRIVFANAQACRISGKSAEELLNRDAREVFPLGINEFRDAFRRARDTRQVIQLEAHYVPMEKWFLTTIYPGDQGYSMFAQDVTARRGVEKALAESEERLRLGLEVGRFGIWDWDMLQDRISWSPQLYRFHGLKPGQFGGRVADFQRLVHEEDAARVGEALRAAIERGTEYSTEFRAVLPSGEIRWLATTGRVLYDENGRPVRMLGATQDVTDRRLAEARLRQMQRVEAAGRLAGGVAHEVNNQMTVVLGLADLMLRSPKLTREFRDDLLQIQRAGERSAQITAQLLAFSRRQMFRPRVLDLNEVVRDFERIIKKSLGESSTLLLRLDPTLLPVYSDRGQLEQVLLNLTLNATDAMPEGGTLTVETSNVTLSSEYAARRSGVVITPGSYCMMAVSDTGHGMAPDVLAHAFDPFFTTKPVGQGSGLGLSSVYGIVKQSSGYIWAYSEPGMGSVFKAYFPAHTDPVPMAQLEAVVETAGGSERLLVVDDEPDVRALMTRALVEKGYEVFEARDGREALGLLQSEGPVKLVLTDVAMPGMNGPELGKQLERSYPGLPVIYMSGYTDADVVLRGLVDQGVPFLQKPFTPDLLAQKVRQVLDE